VTLAGKDDVPMYHNSKPLFYFLVTRVQPKSKLVNHVLAEAAKRMGFKLQPGISGYQGHNDSAQMQEDIRKIYKTRYRQATQLLADLQAANEDVAEKEQELTGLRDNRDDDAKIANRINVAFRAVAKGVFGADSAEYEQAGGTRTSSRAPRGSSKKTSQPGK